jgi:hypothetical protein
MKYTYLLMAASLGLLVGCSQVEQDLPDVNSISESDLVEKVIFEVLPVKDGDDPETKASAVPNGGSVGFVWEATDTVGIYPGRGSQVYFNIEDGVGTNSVSFNGGGWALKQNSTYASYYPFVGDIYLKRDKIPVSFAGQEQIGTTSPFVGARYYLATEASTSENGVLRFSYNTLNTIINVNATLPAGTYTKMSLTIGEPLFVEEGTYSLDEREIVGTKFTNTLEIDLEDVILTDDGTIPIYIMSAPVDLKGKEVTVRITAANGGNYKCIKTPTKAYMSGTRYGLTCDEMEREGQLVSEAVDLGLSVKWASFNLGATKPEEYGNYYAWGETSTKDYFGADNYKFYPNGNTYTVSKYIVPNENGYNAWGTPDYNNVLDLEDDAASVNLGEGWRIPSMDDFQELLDNCSWTPYEFNGVAGYLVKSTINGYQDKSIFLPADESMNGDGIYWSSVLCSKSHRGIGLSDSAGTFDVMRNPSNSNYGFLGYFRQRHNGFLIRPVYGEPARDGVEVISCNPSSVTIHVGEEVQLDATYLPIDAGFNGFEWSVTGGTNRISVTSDGVVKGISSGGGYVESRVGNVSSGCSITILPSAEPANCHVMKTGSETYIQTVKGNSSISVGEVASVSVLWETFNSDVQPIVGDVITSAELKGEVLYVKSGNHEGNAVVAVKDSHGRILWSWHIWVINDEIRQVAYSNNAGVMMNQNIGSIRDCGLLFQWGRKDPFPHNDRNQYDDFVSTFTWPSSVTSSIGGTILYSLQNPTTLIQNKTNYPYYSSDWLSEPNNSLWEEEKTIYDPCPAGWKVPKGGPQGVWMIAGFPSYDVTKANDAPNESPYDTYIPTSGSEDNRGASYWSSTANDSTTAYGLIRSWFWSDDGDADHFSMNPVASLSKQQLGAVRCIKE